jgi:hypothetical protein
VGILRRGDVYFDLLTIPAGQIEKLSEIIKDVNSHGF